MHDRIIFLDVDGVLNNEEAFERDQQHAARGKLDVLDEKCLARLAHVVSATSANIVVTSTWRLQSCTLSTLTAALGRHGVPPGALLGSTPDLEGRCLGDRAREIRAWLKEEYHLVKALSGKTEGADNASPAEGSSGRAAIGMAFSSAWHRALLGVLAILRVRKAPDLSQDGSCRIQREGGCDGQGLPCQWRHQQPAWVAIDDMDLEAMEPGFMAGHFVRTSMRHGLTDALAAQAVDILLAGPRQDP
jgi:hypothetical protein